LSYILISFNIICSAVAIPHSFAFCWLNNVMLTCYICIELSYVRWLISRTVRCVGRWQACVADVWAWWCQLCPLYSAVWQTLPAVAWPWVCFRRRTNILYQRKRFVIFCCSHSWIWSLCIMYVYSLWCTCWMYKLYDWLYKIDMRSGMICCCKYPQVQV